jgi:acyl-CoA reductase-like NAD-dependent aldehyde dehydrogenase
LRDRRSNRHRTREQARDGGTAPISGATEDGQRVRERRYATVNPFTGETEQEFDVTPTEELDGIIGRAHAAYEQWRQRPVEERAGVIRRAAELMDEPPCGARPG